MNLQTFKRKEIYTFLIPVIIIDLLVQIMVFKVASSLIDYPNPEDLVMLKSRVIYFLIVGYAIATVVFPPEIYRRGVRARNIMAQAFAQTLLSYVFFSLSIRYLFLSFDGPLYLLCGVTGTIAVAVVNLLFKQLINLARRHGRNKIHVVVVGSDDNALTLYRNLRDEEFQEYKVLGMFSDWEVPDDMNKLGGVDDLKEYIACNKVHALYCSISPAEHTEIVNSIIRMCDEAFIRFFYVPNMDGYPKRRMDVSNAGNVLVFSLRNEPLLNPYNRFWKRTMDLVICAVFFIFFFPWLYLIIATGIKLSSPGPVFFKQKRTGYEGKPFYLYKFRSMRVNADADKLQATADDPRKTRFGDFLRRSSLDELPQFINVLKGDMSAIGPRPHMEKQTEEYEKLIDSYMLRHLCKPGISGWAQVNGYRGETKELDQMIGRVKYDIWYIENWSLWLDLKIFFMTIMQCVIKDDKQAY